MVRRATNLEHRPPPTARQGAERRKRTAKLICARARGPVEAPNGFEAPWGHRGGPLKVISRQRCSLLAVGASEAGARRPPLMRRAPPRRESAPYFVGPRCVFVRVCVFLCVYSRVGASYVGRPICVCAVSAPLRRVNTYIYPAARAYRASFELPTRVGSFVGVRLGRRPPARFSIL